MHTPPGGGRAVAAARAAAAASPSGRMPENLQALLAANATAAGDRELVVDIGTNYAAVGDALTGKGWSDAFVVTVDARSIELLCEDLGSASANREFNQITHRVLGVAEQIRYCDRRANTHFDTPHRGYDAMKNPINWCASAESKTPYAHPPRPSLLRLASRSPCFASVLN